MIKSPQELESRRDQYFSFYKEHVIDYVDGEITKANRLGLTKLSLEIMAFHEEIAKTLQQKGYKVIIGLRTGQAREAHGGYVEAQHLSQIILNVDWSV